MRKIIVSEFLSLDGVMEAPEQWHFPFISDDMQESVNADVLSSGALLLGRLTYEAFAGFWPTQTQNEFGIADKLNSTPKYVVSSTMDRAEWNNTTIIKDDVITEITKLKQGSGDPISVTGSATLVRSLMEAGLVDEYHLLVHPIVLGTGKRLFSDVPDTMTLKLVNTRTFESGVIALTYQAE